MIGIGWLAREEPRDLSLRVFMSAPDKQPVCALRIEKRPMVTIKAGMMAVAYIQRQAPISGTFLSTR
jgi:hypothetical protein